MSAPLKPEVILALREVITFGAAQAGRTHKELSDVELLAAFDSLLAPIPMRLCCEGCGALHLDEGEFADKSHDTHVCQSCGLTWKPSKRDTVGVRFLPGYKNEPQQPEPQPPRRGLRR